jgi:hypothetical protein
VLVRRDGLVIGQPAHAWVSGQLARAWGNGAFPAPEPREPFCLAAEQHDVGWSDADLAPVAGPDGRPLSFVQQPRAAHVAIWRDAARRLLAQSRYAALLVSLHGTSLYERVDADAEPPDVAAAIRDYMAGERALQAELAAGLEPGEVDRNRRLLLALDRLSLMLCHGRATTLEDVPSARGPATLRLEPAGGDEPAGRAAAPAGGGAPGGPAAAPAGGGAPAGPAAAPLGGDPPASPRAATRDDHAVPPETATARFVLDPWPFAAERVAVGCEARRLEGPRDDLRAALAAAPWVPLRWELSPG